MSTELCSAALQLLPAPPAPGLSVHSQVSFRMELLFFAPSLHTASSILPELDEVIVLGALRSEEHTNFQSQLLALHAEGWLAQGMSAGVPKSGWERQQGRRNCSLDALASKFGNPEVSQVQCEIWFNTGGVIHSSVRMIQNPHLSLSAAKSSWHKCPSTTSGDNVWFHQHLG